jgi:hypothetical protein
MNPLMQFVQALMSRQNGAAQSPQSPMSSPMGGSPFGSMLPLGAPGADYSGPPLGTQPPHGDPLNGGMGSFLGGHAGPGRGGRFLNQGGGPDFGRPDTMLPPRPHGDPGDGMRGGPPLPHGDPGSEIGGGMVNPLAGRENRFERNMARRAEQGFYDPYDGGRQFDNGDGGRFQSPGFGSPAFRPGFNPQKFFKANNYLGGQGKLNALQGPPSQWGGGMSDGRIGQGGGGGMGMRRRGF